MYHTNTNQEKVAMTVLILVYQCVLTYSRTNIASDKRIIVNN